MAHRLADVLGDHHRFVMNFIHSDGLLNGPAFHHSHGLLDGNLLHNRDFFLNVLPFIDRDALLHGYFLIDSDRLLNRNAFRYAFGFVHRLGNHLVDGNLLGNRLRHALRLVSGVLFDLFLILHHRDRLIHLGGDVFGDFHFLGNIVCRGCWSAVGSAATATKQASAKPAPVAAAATTRVAAIAGSEQFAAERLGVPRGESIQAGTQAGQETDLDQPNAHWVTPT